MLLEVVDGGEGTRVFKGRSSPGEGGFDQGCHRCEEERRIGCEEERRIGCQEEERRAEGSGWLATPNGCRLLAQVKICFLKSDRNPNLIQNK